MIPQMLRVKCLEANQHLHRRSRQSAGLSGSLPISVRIKESPCSTSNKTSCVSEFIQVPEFFPQKLEAARHGGDIGMNNRPQSGASPASAPFQRALRSKDGRGS